MHSIKTQDEIKKLFVGSSSLPVSLENQFVLILRQEKLTFVWKNVQSLLTFECYPNGVAKDDVVPRLMDFVVLNEKNGKSDNLVCNFKLVIHLKGEENLPEFWLIGDDRTEKVTQVFLAYESPITNAVETVVIVEGDEKKPKSCGSMSFSKDAKKALNVYVKIVKALMGLSDISLTPLLDGYIPQELPKGSESAVKEMGEKDVG